MDFELDKPSWGVPSDLSTARRVCVAGIPDPAPDGVVPIASLHTGSLADLGDSLMAEFTDFTLLPFPLKGAPMQRGN